MMHVRGRRSALKLKRSAPPVCVFRRPPRPRSLALVTPSLAMAAAVDFKKLLQKPLVAADTMPADSSSEAVEIVTASVDKFLATENYEKASQAIKDGFDKKFGPSWHCVVGEGFGYHITCNAHNMLYLYYGEKLGILVFKC